MCGNSTACASRSARGTTRAPRRTSVASAAAPHTVQRQRVWRLCDRIHRRGAHHRPTRAPAAPRPPEIGLLWTLALGVAGSVIGGTIANLIGTGDIMELNVIGFIVAVFASVGLLAAAERAGLGQGDDRKRLTGG